MRSSRSCSRWRTSSRRPSLRARSRASRSSPACAWTRASCWRAGVLFLLSLALRRRLPLLPLGLAFVTLGLAGRLPLTLPGASWPASSWPCTPTGAWAGGRAGQVGALGVGALAGLAVLRTPGPGSRRATWPWPVFVLARRVAARPRRAQRAGGARGRPHRRPADWEAGRRRPRFGRSGRHRPRATRRHRALHERGRAARRAPLDGCWQAEPEQARRSLAIIEAAGTEALEETQRLTGLLLSPDGTPLPEPRPGLDDLDYLAVSVTDAGLRVAVRVEGEPAPLTPDLDAVAYRVVHEALMSTLHHSQAERSDVVVRYLPDELQVEVVDDGVGTEDADAPAGHVGSAGRARRGGGTGWHPGCGPGHGPGVLGAGPLPLRARLALSLAGAHLEGC